MKRNNIIKKLFLLPISIRYGYYLEYGKYEKLEEACRKKLEKNDKDFIALFYGMYVYSYQRKIALAKQFFYKMFELHELAYKTRRFFIINIINLEIENKNYIEAIDDCNRILLNEKSIELKKILKRILCEANYYLHNFEKVKNICNKLSTEYKNDNEMQKFIKAYIEAIKNEHDI